MNVEVEVNIVLFISGSHLCTCVYKDNFEHELWIREVHHYETLAAKARNESSACGNVVVRYESATVGAVRTVHPVFTRKIVGAIMEGIRRYWSSNINEIRQFVSMNIVLIGYDITLNIFYFRATMCFRKMSVCLSVCLTVADRRA